MKKKLLHLVGAFTLLSFPTINFAQAPNLGTAANFVLFSTTGAIGNTGISHITGNVGTNSGAISAFSNVDGVMHSPDGVTSICATDLQTAYTQLNTATPTSSHAVLLGSGETLYAGVYSIPGATAVNNSLTLDGEGNENAVFIFQIQGAFSSGTFAQINLINCAKAGNVFWKVEGAVSLAAGTTMRGNIVANNAAISLGAGVTLEGRALSTTGAIAVFGVLAYTPVGFGSTLLTGPSAPVMASAACYALFSANGVVSNTGITSVMGDIGTNFTSTTGYDPLFVNGTVHAGPDVSTAVCAADLNNAYSYLNTLPYDIQLLYPAAFGNSLVLTPHSYLMNGAVTFTDTIFLNAEGNANAVFVINANGPLSTSINSKVIFMNGAQARNVFWIIEGAVTINDNSDFKGTIVCNNGAIILNTGATLEGRAFTTTGALTTTSVIITSVAAATISYPGSPYCSNGGTAPVTLSGASGGNYSSTTGIVIDPSSGTVDLSLSEPGIYTVTYLVAAADACSASSTTAIVTIISSPSATMSYSGSPFCSNTGIAMVTFTGTTGGIFSSSPIGVSINPVTGTIDLSASTPGRFTTTYTISRCLAGCGVTNYAINNVILINPNTWTGGVSSDWNIPGNWAANVLPLSTCADVTILSGVPYQPMLDSGTFAIQNLFINPGANLIVRNAILQISGSINNSGTFNVSEGTIDMNGAFAQTIPAGTFSTNKIQNLIISNNVTLGGEDSLTGVLSFGGSNKDFATNGFLTLKSTSKNTASVADITNAGSSSGNTISGNVKVERYIPAHRAWRLLTTPTSVIGGQTINAAYQEGADPNNLNDPDAGSNPCPGYGTHVTGGLATNGFDQGVNSNPGIKRYANGAWVAFPNTNATLISSEAGYMLFVRGDRSIDLSQGIYAAPTNTVLRSSGRLNTGDQAFAAITPGFTLMRNPYASRIIFHNISRGTVPDIYYLWDPNLTGTNGVGGYITFTYNGGSYIASPMPVSSFDLTGGIESGSAFFINNAAADTITIKESDKASGSANVFRPMSAPEQLRTNLYSYNADGTKSLQDGTLFLYSNSYSNAVDLSDARKMTNISENLGIKNGTFILSIEKRQSITSKDTLLFNMTTLKVKSYQFEFIAENLNNLGLAGFLEDSYFNTSTAIDLNGTTTFNFTVVNIPGSWNPSRFRIVFRRFETLPIIFNSIRAFQQNHNIEVQWKVENETGIKQYAVERSGDGFLFTQSTIVLTTYNSDGKYKWLDENALEGNNLYRIRILGVNGDVHYSSVVKVYIGKGGDQIVLNSTVITNETINFQINNMQKGRYGVRLLNNLGQVMYVKQIDHAPGNNTVRIELKIKPAKGTYILEFTKPDNKKITKKVFAD
ncbi:MAG: ice-binding family protein [Ferruginibacter sp.]